MPSPAAVFRFGRFELRPALRQLLIDGQPAPLGGRAFDLLQVLVEQRDHVLTHDELLERVWPGLVVDENNLRQHVSALRKLLGAEAIVTVAGRGYRFGLAIEEADLNPPDASARTGGGAAGGATTHLLINLPANLPELIGREVDLAAVVERLATTQLLTVVGAGGVGKTRLALEVAKATVGDYADGACLVELAPVNDPQRVPHTVAQTLGVHEEPGRPLLDTLLEYLRHRRMLIVLDNCEHLIDSCARHAEQVLRHCAGVRTLATSREALNITGEVAWRLPSLTSAEPGAAQSPEQLLEFAASRLFVQRASAAQPTFALNHDNLAAVATICHRLDGIPLALELAAARVGAMPVELVAERLQDRFALLTRGGRTALQRHQTLRSLIDWSHGLLSERERTLLRRLSLFAGGFTLEAAEAVCSGEPLPRGDVLDVLTQLVEKSLVVLVGGATPARYRLLETIRQYGLEKLTLAEEVEATRLAHLNHYVDLAERIRPMLTTAEQLSWHARAEIELDNLRVALNSALVHADAELGLRLFSSLTRFWYKNMLWKEMVGWQQRLCAQLVRQGREHSLHYARALYGSGMLATNFDPVLGRELCDECLPLSRTLEFAEGMAWALMWMGYIDTRRRDPATRELFEESRRIGQTIEDPWRRAFLLAQMYICHAGYEALMGRDDSAEAMVALCDAEMARIGGDKLYLGHGLALLGTIAIRREHFERAGELLAESLALYRAVESPFDIAGSLAQQGFLALHQSQPVQALALFKESLPHFRNHPMSPSATRGLAQLLIAHAACTHWSAAARLAGALGGTTVQEAANCGAPPELSGRVQRAYEAGVASTRSALGEREFARLAEAGRRMTREEAITLALAEGAT